jgi:hypothetical protein
MVSNAIKPKPFLQACGWVIIKRMQYCSLAMVLHCELEECKLLIKKGKVY